jgi:rhodanese-related sulfurtransferase
MPRRTIDELLAETRARIRRWEPEEAARAIADGAVLIDIRDSAQRAEEGEIPGALWFARNVLEWRMDPDCPWRAPDAPPLEATVIVTCQHGYASSFAAASLQAVGFARAGDLAGGFEAWRDAGLPVRSAAAASP